jgi:transposase
MDIYLDTLLHLPFATVESFREVDDFTYFKIGLINEEISCPHCQKIISEIRQIEYVLIRDLSVFGKKVYLQVPRRQFYCPDCHKYSTERLEFIEWRHRYTRRYEESISKKVKHTSIEEVSREEELSRDVVQSIFNYLEERRKQDWGHPKRIGMDEFSRRKGHKDFITVVSDIDAVKPLEIIEGRKGEKLIEVLSEKELEVRKGVEEVSVDMWAGFTKVIKKVFPNARIVYDRFHVMQQLNRELNKLRKLMKVTGRKVKTLLLHNRKDLTNAEKEELDKTLIEHPCLQIAYEIKEKLREIYEKRQTFKGGKREIEKWLKTASILYRESAQMIQEHLEGVCNYFTNRTTNAVAEGMNTKIKLIMRQGYGFSNFDNFQLRLLAAFDV